MSINVLSLHRMGDPRFWRNSVSALELMFQRTDVDINCVCHDTNIPFPDDLKDVEFHLIVLGPTFLGSRYNKRMLNKTLVDYAFIAENTSACKIALPQDDYDCSALLDNWMCAWRIDRVYTVCPNHWDVLYPNYVKMGEVKLGYTGFISDALVAHWSSPLALSDRQTDVSYRAAKLPENFGSLGVLKSEIATRFKAAVPQNTLKLDISVNAADMIPGPQWLDFIESSRACLVTPSGSSLLDPYGNYRQCVEAYVSNDSERIFEEVALQCFPGEDMKYVFEAVSPRNYEAALAQTVQIGVVGAYSGLMVPYEHYFPLEKDCSNIDDVICFLKDNDEMKLMSARCKEMFLNTPSLKVENFIAELLTFSSLFFSKKHKSIVVNHGDKIKIDFYNKNIRYLSASFWFVRRVKETIKKSIFKFK